MVTTTIPAPFTFDLDDAAEAFAAQGWVHRPAGVDADLFAQIAADTRRFLGGKVADIESWRFPGKKDQYLWELPPGTSIEALCAAVAHVAGFDPSRTILAERHVKIYGEAAEAMPPAHKDRSASTLTVGIGIDVPADSRLVMWPEIHLEPNPYPSSAEWRNSRRPEELPEVVLDGTPPMEIDLRAGDIVFFRGAAIYHERYRPANTAVLYLKFNADGLDPLGEDPRTPTREAESAALAANGLPASATLVIGPRVVGLRTDEYFPSGARHTQARFLDREIDVALTQAEEDLVRRVLAARSIRLGELDGDARDTAGALVARGVLLAG